MAELKKLSDGNIKDEEESAIKRNIDNSDKINFDREDEKMAIQNVGSNNSSKRYSLNELLSLRNAQQSIHYPHCAIRPELQVFSVWTCRLRCELQYLGLWKIPNAGNAFGNCNCNGSCQSYACEGQPFPFHNSQAYSGTSQMSYANVPNSLQAHQMLSSSPTMGSKKAERSRERFLNYQRNINSELIRATSPTGEREGSLHYMNHQSKPAFIDHRSISSSHLMPAFAKRRMGHANASHGQLDAGSHYNSGGNEEHLSNDGSLNENFTNNDTSGRPRKESVKSTNDPVDYHLYKGTVKGRMVKNDRNNSDYSPSGNKVSPGTVNKKLISERRIGSGRLIPREVSLEMRSGNKKRIEKETPNIALNNVEKENDNLPRAIDKQANRNSSIGRYSDPQVQDMRIFDRRISSSEDSTNASRIKKYTNANIDDERNNYDSNYQQGPHFTGKRSISFRRREYVDPKDHHRDFRDFRDRKESRDGRENREQREDDHHHHHHHFYHRDNKEEPEWFSEGPTSQHETIELRGFEENEDTQQPEEQTPSDLYSKTEKMSSNSSLLSINSNSNVNLSTKPLIDISNEMSNNSNNTLNNDVDNISNCIENIHEADTKSIEKKEAIDLKEELQKILPITDEYENSEKQRSNVTELFIDNFLNMEAIENSLISGANDQSTTSLNNGGGTSRFSRWFFNNSNNVNSNDELNNNPPSKDETKQQKDINESDFNSFMSFFKCNNYHTPELPKGLPSNVSALSVEELEARMRKMDTNELEKPTSSDSGQNLHKNALSVEELEARMRKLETYEMENFGDSHNLRRNDINQTKKLECPSKPEASPQPEINTQDVEAFRKLLDQLGKPPVDIAMNMNMQGPPGQPQPIKAHGGAFPSVLPQLPIANPLPQINMPKQEFMIPTMHQQQPIIHRQQNVAKIPLFSHQYQHSGMQQLQPENIPFMSVSHHPHAHHVPMMIGQPQKRLDVQHLIQSVVRGELSRSFLEKELQNRNISPYNKEVITTVLKETSRFNVPDAIVAAPNSDQSVAPNNLMQSLARGEVSLNFVEHELNKLNNMNININDASASATFKERSRCGTPLTSSLNVASIPTSGSMIVPLASQVVPRQEQNSILSNETVSADQQQQHHQNISSMYRSSFHDQHSQAMMQNALFKKKLEMEQQEALRRRQENFKQQKQEPDFLNQLHQQQQQSLISNSTISQQGHQQSSRQINNPTPLAFMPTSVLRKMTAEKEPITSYSHATATPSSSTQPHLQQPHLKIPTHPQMSYQPSNQPRIILGRGNFQYIHQQQQQPQIPPAVNDSSQFLHNKNLNYAINGHF